MALTKATNFMISGSYANAWDYMTAAEIADVQAGTLSLDVTSALQTWLTAIGTGSFEGTITGTRQGYLPPGKYKITSTLTVPANTTIVGVPWNSTIRPTSAVGAGNATMVVRAGCTISGIVLDGTGSSGIDGFVFGPTDALIANNFLLDNCFSGNFTQSGGNGGSAYWLRRVVYGTFRSCWGYNSTRGAYLYHPTEAVWNTVSAFHDCTFRENDIGVYIRTGHLVEFSNCNYELNGENAIYCNYSTVANSIDSISVNNCWFEANWYSLVGDPSTRITKYDVEVIGANEFSMRDCKLSETGANGPRGVDFASASKNFVLDNNEWNYFRTPTINAQTNTSGHIANWPTDKSITTYLAKTGTALVFVDGQAELSKSVSFRGSGDLSVSYTKQEVTISKGIYTTTVNIALDCVPTFTTASGDIELDAELSTNVALGTFYDGSMSFSGITKTNYTQFTPEIQNGSNDIKIRSSGSGQALAYVTYANISSGAPLKLYMTLTFRNAGV